MPKAYWIVHVTVHDPEHYPEYLTAALPIFEKYGADFVVRGGAYEVRVRLEMPHLENWAASRTMTSFSLGMMITYCPIVPLAKKASRGQPCSTR